MSLVSKHIVLIFLLLIGGTGITLSQDADEYERELSTLLQKITDTEKRIQSIKKDQQESLAEARALEQQIQNRQKAIDKLAEGVALLDADIQETEDIIESLEGDVHELKLNYGELLRHQYKTRSMINDIVFVFSAETFNKAFKRMRYLEQYNSFRQEQLELILETAKSLGRKKSELEKKKNKQQELLNIQEEQRAQLEQEKQRKNRLLAKLKNERVRLEKEFEEQKVTAQVLEKKMEEAIKAASTREEDIGLSANFSDNKGKLPWPVQGNAFITRTFGKHPHPIYPNTWVDNSGVDIKADPGTRIRAVYEGTVVVVDAHPIFQNAVIINHGKFFTVYSNLKTVYVKTGDKVGYKQNIGVVYTDEETKKTEVHLEVWEGKEKMDPEKWLHKR